MNLAKWKNLSVQQKLLSVVAATVVITAFFILLSVWGIEIDSKIVGRIVTSCIVIGVVAGILIAISSNMREASKKDDKDNFFN